MGTFVSYEYIGELLRELDEAGITPSEAAEVLRVLVDAGLFSQKSSRPATILKEWLEEMRVGRLFRDLKSLMGLSELSDREAYDELARMLKTINIDSESLGEAIIDILCNPTSCSFAKLEAMRNHIELLLRLREMGVGSIGRRASEKLRRELVNLILPSVRDLLVPKWAFEALERELKSAYQKVRHKELEVERLKKIIKQRGSTMETTRLYLVIGLLDEQPSRPSGRHFKLFCPWCKEINYIQLPSKEEVEVAMREAKLYRAHCKSCSRVIDIEPEKIADVIESSKNNNFLAAKEEGFDLHQRNSDPP